MIKFILKIVGALLFIGFAVLLADELWYRHRISKLGPGVSLRYGQLIECEVARPTKLASLKRGDQLLFSVKPGGQISSTNYGDAVLNGAKLVAIAQSVRHSETLGRRVATFHFTRLKLPGRAVNFQATSQDIPQTSPADDTQF